MLCTYFTSYRVVSLRAAWVTFDAPGWLDRDPYGIHTSSLHIIIRSDVKAALAKWRKLITHRDASLVKSKKKKQ